MRGVSIGRTLILSMLFGILVMGALSLFANFGETFDALRRMNWFWLPLLCLLSLVNYLLRFLKWEYFLRVLGVRLKLLDSFGIFLSGFVFSVTPGKLGEVFKAWLVRELEGTPASRVAPVVLAERYTDLGGLLILASAGIYASGMGHGTWILGAVLLVLLYVLATSKALRHRLPTLVGRFKPLSRKAESVALAMDSSRELLRARTLPGLMLFSAFSWLFEAWALGLAVRAMGARIPILESIYVYSLSMLAGTLAFLPGGLGVTEGSLTLLLVNRSGMDAGSAAAITLVARFATLWFAVILGVVVLLAFLPRWKLGPRLWGRIDLKDSENAQDASMTEDDSL